MPRRVASRIIGRTQNSEKDRGSTAVFWMLFGSVTATTSPQVPLSGVERQWPYTPSVVIPMYWQSPLPTLPQDQGSQPIWWH